MLETAVLIMCNKMLEERRKRITFKELNRIWPGVSNRRDKKSRRCDVREKIKMKVTDL
jgi:hypothetical protein